jgi:predicted PurR-regulated permease PerM
MKARERLERAGQILRGIAIAAVIAGVLAYVVEWLRLHRDTEPPPWTWVAVVVVGAVLLLVRIVDAVVTSIRQALTDTPRAQTGDRPGRR